MYGSRYLCAKGNHLPPGFSLQHLHCKDKSAQRYLNMGPKEKATRLPESIETGSAGICMFVYDVFTLSCTLLQ